MWCSTQYSRYMNSFTKETGDRFLQRASSTKNFPWIWLVFQDSHGRLLFCFGLTSVDPWLVTCDDLKTCFKTPRMYFLKISCTCLLLSGCQIVQHFLRCLSHGRSHVDTGLLAHARHQCCQGQILFLDSLPDWIH